MQANTSFVILDPNGYTMPVQYARVHAGILPPKAEDLLMDRVGDCIDDYLYAVLRD